VLKEVVCFHSPDLNAVFNSGFIEGQTQTYRLDDTTERAFRLLVQWLYFQKFELIQLTDDWEQSSYGNAEKAEEMSLVELWVLADKLSMLLLLGG